MHSYGTDVNVRYTPTRRLESLFRQQVRDILDLDWSTRNDQIFEELRRFKELEVKMLQRLVKESCR